MNKELKKDYEKAVDFWNKNFALTDEDDFSEVSEDEWKEVSSPSLYKAAESFKDCENVLDYGCGYGWAATIMAKCGVKKVTAVDLSENAIEFLRRYANAFKVLDRIDAYSVDDTWLSGELEEKYDGVFCSNVIDVIPTDVSKEILKNIARISKKNAKIIFGTNYYMEPIPNEERKTTIKNGNYIFVDGVLRLVSLTDDEWKEIMEPYFAVDEIEYFRWNGEPETVKRRLFHLTKK